jgi:ADP-ribose pyrophosphatase
MAADVQALESKVVYQNRWMRVREDRIVRPDGSTGIYGVVEKPDFVTIAAVECGCVYLVEQFRYPVGGRFWELPQGSWEHSPDADPLEIARAELREETGLHAKEMVYAGRLFLAYGYSNQAYHVFIGRGLALGPRKLEQEEQDLVSRRFDIAEVEAMVRDGVIRDATTVAALGLIRLKRLL